MNQNSKANVPLFTGVWCPSITPFDIKGKLDLPGLEKHLQRLTDAGIDGVLLMGTIGEFAALSMDERLLLIREARKMSDLPMIAHVSSTCVEDMVHLAKAAYETNYAAVMVLPQYYYAQTPHQILEYYRDLDKKFGGSWLVYNFPARTGCDVNAPIIAKLAADLPRFVGLKDTVDCLSHSREIIQAVADIRQDFSVFAGYDEYLIPNLMNGGAGALSGLNNVVPELFVQTLNAYKNHNLAEVAALQKEISRLSKVYAIGDDFVTAIKTAVANKYHYLQGISRSYGGALDAAQNNAVNTLFK